MSFTREAKRRARAAVPPLAFLALVAYFGWNVVNGDRGLRSYAVRQEQLQILKDEQARVEAERDAWARRVAGLRNDHLDPDTLDERARAMLNFADPSDIVVPYPPGKRLF